MKHSAVTLEDKYEVDSDRFYLTGTQALVRLRIEAPQRAPQKWRRSAAKRS